MVNNHNYASLYGARHLAESSVLFYKSLTRLASGFRFSSPEHDPAGLARFLRFKAQTSRADASSSNFSSALCFSHTQEDYLSKVAKALDRMGELSILAQDSTRTAADRALYNEEFARLGAAVTEVGAKDYNGNSLFRGAPLKVTTDGGGDLMTLLGVDLISVVYSLAAQSVVDSKTNAGMALRNVRAAIAQLTADRAVIGSNLSVLEGCGAQSMGQSNRLTEARRQNQNADVAAEGTESASLAILAMAKSIVLDQASFLKASELKAAL